MLDTNTVSYLMSGHEPRVRQAYLDAELEAWMVISAITEAEIRHGLEKKPGALRLRNSFRKFLEAVQMSPWGSQAAMAYARLRREASMMGKSLSEMDFLIAAHAVAASAILVSHDRAFRQLASLQVIDWMGDANETLPF